MSFECAAQKACVSALIGDHKNQKGRRVTPLETELIAGLERLDGFLLIRKGFDEHVKSAECKGGLCFPGEIE